MKKLDRKSLLRRSMPDEDGKLARRLAVAEQAMAGRAQGLLADAEPEGRYSSMNTAAEQKSPVAKGRLLQVPLARVHDNPMNARHVYAQDIIKELAASIAIHGQLEPAAAVPHPALSGEFMLIDGHYRKRALLAAGRETMDCVVVEDDLGPVELYQRSYILNEERSSQTTLDNALAWRRLLDEGLVSSEEGIGSLLGISQANVAKTLAILRLPVSAIGRIREAPGKFGLALSYELALCAKVMSEAEVLELVDKVLQDGLTVREVSALRSRAESKPRRPPKEFSRKYKLMRGGSQVGTVRVWDTAGKITLELMEPDPSVRESMVAEFMAWFSRKDEDSAGASVNA